jgi:Mo-co oxidoreductase dimerisation domain
MKPGETGVKMIPINRMIPRSFITNIKSGKTVRVGAPTIVRGIAFGGDTGVAQVDLSSDGGKTWQATQLGKDEWKYGFRQWRTRFKLTAKVTTRMSPNRSIGRVQVKYATQAIGNSERVLKVEGWFVQNSKKRLKVSYHIPDEKSEHVPNNLSCPFRRVVRDFVIEALQDTLEKPWTGDGILIVRARNLQETKAEGVIGSDIVGTPEVHFSPLLMQSVCPG